MKSGKIVSSLMMSVGLCLSSQAVILPPGGSGIDAPQSPGPTPPLATETEPFSNGELNGTVTSWVVKDPANPFGGLSFYYQLVNNGPTPVQQLTSSDFGIIPAGTVEVSWTMDGYSNNGLAGGQFPTTANRSSGAGSLVNYLFQEEIPSIVHSDVLIINTAYQGFQQSQGSIMGFDGTLANVALLGPAVPEPATFLAASLLLIPLGASALRKLRRR